MTQDTASTWITTLMASMGVILLIGAVLLSATGPEMEQGTAGILGGPSGPSEASKALDRGDTVLFGAWLGAWPTADDDHIDRFEQTTGTSLEIVDTYLDWSTPVDNVTHSIEHVAQHGAVPHLTWEPQGITTPEIIDGNKTLHLRGGETPSIDAYIETFAQGVCEASERTGDPVLVRVMHEMNGRWFHWGIGYKAPDGTFPNTNETFKQAWRKLDRTFDRACASGGEVRMVWAVNHASVGRDTSFTGAYPGDAYVDYVGIDGYNWGGVADWGWSSFPELFDHAYCEVTAGTDRPVLISEWGSVEPGGDKAAWIEQALERVADGAYPEVQAMIWLNDLKKEREIGDAVDWRINSSQASLEAYARGIEHVEHTWTPTYEPGGETSVCT